MPAALPPPLYDGNQYESSQSVGHQLFKLTMMMRRELESRMTGHGLTDAQWKPLWILKSRGEASAVEMAREMDVDAGAVTRLLDRLEAKGLLERVRSEFDRRVVHLKLTAAGDAAAEQIPHLLAGLNNDFLRGFSASEWHQLRALLDRMLGNGSALCTERTPT